MKDVQKTKSFDNKQMPGDVKIGKTIYRLTCVYSGEKEIASVLEELAVEKMLEKAM